MVELVMSTETTSNGLPEREFEDIQRLVRYGNGHLPEACFMLLQVRDASAARDWLQAAPVTNVEQAGSRPERALQVAFTAAGLQALEVPAAVIQDFSDEFIVGMNGDVNRSRRLGDIGANAPEHWQWGNTATPQVLLMLYAQTDSLQSWIDSIEDDSFAGAFEIQQKLLTSTLGPNEPFGFMDGISQPEIDWKDQLSTDLHERNEYTNKLKTGEILLGYRNEYGLYTDRPLLDANAEPAAEILPPAEDQPDLRDLGRNGCYLVMRQLDQDVPGFWQFVDQTSGGDEAEREQLASAMVGRSRDGTPLVAGSSKAASKSDRDNKPENNGFNFDLDPLGHQCPVGAHIRRANPRTGDFAPGTTNLIIRLLRTLGFCRRHPNEDLISSTRFHRLLRRGRAYGPGLAPADAVKTNAAKAERGLHFICIGANILRQFEFVQNAWLMNSKFAGLAGESDPLMGNRETLFSGEATNGFTRPRAGAPAQCPSGLPQFITVKGGAYFFMPGLKALRFIATHPGGDSK
jgi:deferrochelatase/peroxidase EfeB